MASLSKVYIIKLTKPPTVEKQTGSVCYVRRHRGGAKRYLKVLVRRGTWFFAYDSHQATSFDCFKTAGRVLKSAVIGRMLKRGWSASIHVDVTPGRREPFQSRQLVEVWPNPNAIELLAAAAGEGGGAGDVSE